jgi:hypothetical protein
MGYSQMQKKRRSIRALIQKISHFIFAEILR